MSVQIAIDHQSMEEFCRRWSVTEFALFGSVLRDDFRPDSDVDVLLSFAPTAHWSLLDIVQMQDELGTMFDRPTQIVEARALRNPFRRHEILTTRRILYAA